MLALLGLTIIAMPLRAEYTNQVARKHYENGLVYASKGYADLAIKELEEAVRLEPGAVEGHRFLAVAYSLRMTLKRAVKEYEALFQTSPGMSEVPALNVYWLEEKNVEILEELKRNLELFRQTQPPNPMVHALLGWLYGEEGRLRDAYTELLHAMEESPSLGKGHLGQEDKVVASLVWELVMAMQNNSSLAKTQLGLLLFALTGNT